MLKQKYWLYGILILALLIPSVSAQDEEQLPSITPKAGITPDSAFYVFDVLFDDVRATLTPSPLGKAKVRLDIMQERVVEMEEMAAKNKIAEAKRAELEAQKQMQKFESSARNIEKKDVPELNEYIQMNAATLELFKQRLRSNDNPDHEEAIADVLTTLETSSDVIANIPGIADGFESLKAECLEAGGPPDYCESLEAKCREAGATTTEECKKVILAQYESAVLRSGPPGSRPPDPHNCSGWYSDGKTKWCCRDSDRTYSSEWIEMRKEEGMGNILHYYHRKGTVEYKIINLKDGTIEEGIEVDSCEGNTLTEWRCPDSMDRFTLNKRYSEEYECPDGCEDGACITCNLDSICDENEDCSCPDCEAKRNGCQGFDFVCQDGECVYGGVPDWAEVDRNECTDSDEGQDFFVKGTVIAPYPPDLSYVTHYAKIDHCIDDTQLREFSCEGPDAVSEVIYSCPNGCQDGACIYEAENLK